MRIILKPAGLAVLLVAFGGLATAVAYDRTLRPSQPPADSGQERLRVSLLSRFKNPALPSAAMHPILENAGFEGGFEAVGKREPGRGVATTHRGGQVAYPWRDDSDWADVSVSYAKETAGQHGGTACQRVTVQAVRAGAVQMVQSVHPVKGQTYITSCWFKSDRPVSVMIGLRQSGQPFTYYGQTEAKIGTEWQQLSVPALVKRHEDALFVVQLKGPANLLMDDADLKPVPSQVP